MRFIRKNKCGNHLYSLLIASLVLFLIVSCGTREKSDKEHDGDREYQNQTEMLRGEHDREGGVKSESEEDGTELAIYEKYIVTKHGLHLELSYDRDYNSFIGFMKNVSESTVENARVEIHLSNGTELGPTKPMTLDPGMKTVLRIEATIEDFTGWTAHAEVGSFEHSEEHNGENGEHDGEKGEHQ